MRRFRGSRREWGVWACGAAAAVVYIAATPPHIARAQGAHDPPPHRARPRHGRDHRLARAARELALVGRRRHGGPLAPRDGDRPGRGAARRVPRAPQPRAGNRGVQLETYNTFDVRYDGGVRARFVSPFARFGVGFDYVVRESEWRFAASLHHPIRRGGLFRDGSMLRLDVVPGKALTTFTLGVEKPIRRRIPLGTTRPLHDHVSLRNVRAPAVPPLPASPALRDALGEARGAALVVQQLVVPWLDHTGTGNRESDARVLQRIAAMRDVVRGALARGTGGRNAVEREMLRLHAAVDRAFSIALDPSAAERPGASEAGHALGNHARAILLAQVILPYDRPLGQVKRDDTTREYAIGARGTFARALHVQMRLPRQTADDALAVFTRLLEIVDAARAAAHREWGGSRFVWLPLQLTLHPDEHDTQKELDALVERATGAAFSDGNYMSWVINEQFQYQLSRTIREARDFHVLWTHDFRGIDAQGDPDEMSYRHVLRSYLAALTARVRAYDSTGTFPVYMIVLDEWFYRVNEGRLWMSLLEDPVHHRISLPPEFREWEVALGAAQDSLRAAIAASPLLANQRRQYGEGWLRNLVKVHVSITNASDPTFRSWLVATGFPAPDNWMRDHRKIVFYDLSEDDPYRGGAMFTGAGVGEHYANFSWEDRSLLASGPAVLSLKEAARDLFHRQGIPTDRIPAVLRARALPHEYLALVDAAAKRNGRPLRATMLQNATGFDQKDVNVGKAILYTLMPPGSVIKIPDSLWNGTFWGASLVGCALRGVRVLVIAPSLANAPARAFGSMVRSRELLWRLAAANRDLAAEIAAEIAAAGGLLRVGLYDSGLSIADIPGKVRAVRTTFEREPWIKALFGFPETVYPELEELAASLGELQLAPPPRSAGAAPRDFESRTRPLLHLKANFLASPEGWGVMAHQEWIALTWAFVQQRIAQVQSRNAAVVTFEPHPDALIEESDGLVQRWFDELLPAQREKVVFYTILGSHNQNDRSLVVDGEDAIVLSGWPSVIPYLDLISLIGSSVWVNDPSEVDRLIPRQSSLKRRLAHWVRVAF